MVFKVPSPLIMGTPAPFSLQTTPPHPPAEELWIFKGNHPCMSPSFSAVLIIPRSNWGSLAVTTLAPTRKSTLSCIKLTMRPSRRLLRLEKVWEGVGPFFLGAGGLGFGLPGHHWISSPYLMASSRAFWYFFSFPFFFRSKFLDVLLDKKILFMTMSPR